MTINKEIISQWTECDFLKHERKKKIEIASSVHGLIAAFSSFITHCNSCFNVWPKEDSLLCPFGQATHYEALF